MGKIYLVSIGTFIFISALVARANFVGNDTNNFNPVPGGVNFVTVHGSEALDPGRLSLGVFFTYARNSLPDTFDVNGVTHGSDDHVTFSDVGMAYGLTKRLELGLIFSTLMSQKTDRALTGAQFGQTGLNEIRLAAKYNFVRRDPWGFAVVTSANINQSEGNPFAGMNNGPTMNIELVLDRQLEDWLFGLNLGYRARENDGPIPDAVYRPLPNQYIGSVAVSHFFPTADLKFVGEVSAVKAEISTNDVRADLISSEVLIGLKFDAARRFSVQGGGGTRLGEGLFTPDWRVYFGTQFNYDFLPEVSKATAHPGESLTTPVIHQVSYGYLPSDVDKLREVPFDEISKNHEFHLRTQMSPDLNVGKSPFEIIRLENFDFESGVSALTPAHRAQLDQMFTYLSSSPPIIKVRVEGHTDSRGSPERNQRISHARAESVVAYLLLKRAVNQMQIHATGFGPARPIADNGDADGRKRNRRVEIRVLRSLPAAP